MPPLEQSDSNTETVRLQLPSGEMINGIVPAGLSDDQVKSYVRMKRPDLFGPPAGIQAPPRPNMQQVDITGKPQNPGAGVAAMSGASSSPAAATPGYSAAVGAPLAGAATYMGGAVALPFLGAFAKAHPVIAQATASEAITQARRVPYVGKFIPPYAEWLPFLLSHGQKPAPAEPVEGNVTARPQAPAEAPAPAQPPFLKQRAAYPPPEPTGAYDKPVKAPSGISDALDDQAIREEVRGRVAQADRKWQMDQSRRDWAANTVNRTKGEMIQQAQSNVAPRVATPAEKRSGALKRALDDLDPESAQPYTPPRPTVANGNTYEYSGGQFMKNGKVLDKSGDIADATDILEAPKGKPIIEGQLIPKRKQITAPSSRPQATDPTDDLTGEWQKSLEHVRKNKRLAQRGPSS